MGTAKPKKHGMLWINNFAETAKVYITLHPQQKWKYKIDGEKVNLEYKHTDLQIPKADFEKYWKVVE
ncbi:MAG: hypothetical protein IKW21_02435 [Lachnospiraceae bacterium]|nr:hypothetical protein [Lachnospiraceae bacterium]